MHVPVAAERRTVPAPEEVPERVGRRDTAREVRSELAIERRDDIAFFESEPGGGGDGLLAQAVVQRPADPSLPVERRRALLERPLQKHQPEELETCLSSQEGPRLRPQARARTGGTRPRARGRRELACPAARARPAARQGAQTLRRRGAQGRDWRRRPSVRPPGAKGPATSCRSNPAPLHDPTATACAGR